MNGHKGCHSEKNENIDIVRFVFLIAVEEIIAAWAGKVLKSLTELSRCFSNISTRM